MSNLFRSYQLGPFTLKNRIVMPAMVTFGHGTVAGQVTDSLVEHYRQRARSQPGLLIVESTAVRPKNPHGSEQRGLWEDAQIEGQKRIAEAIHKEEVPCLVQIQTSGVVGKNEPHPKTISPYQSDQTGALIQGEEMTLSEIHALQQRFIEAAFRAKQAGYDGVELHAAHSYFLSQCLSPVVNVRTDAYGGNPENRAKLVAEIAEGILQRCGKDFFIAIRMGANDPDADAAAKIIGVLQKAGIGLFDISWGFLPIEKQQIPLVLPKDWKLSPLVYTAKLLKERVEAPLVCVGNICTKEQAEKALEENAADLVAIGRNYLIEPYWAEKARQGAPIQPCYHCKECRWFGDWKTCPAVRKKGEGVLL